MSKYSLKYEFNGNAPKRRYRGKEVIIGVLPHHWKLPTSPDDAYDLFLAGHYYFKGDWNDMIALVGRAEDLLRFLAEDNDNEYIFPQVYPNHFKFNRWDLFQCDPIREGMRRHYDQRAKVYDIDLCIS